MKKIIHELQRRNVIKSAIAYLVVAWLLTQVMAIIIPAFELPVSSLRVSIIVLVIVFPGWLMFSWIYEVTPDGIKKTTDDDTEESIDPATTRRLNRIIFGALGLATVLLIFTLATSKQTFSDTPISEELVAPASIDKSIAVLAFADMSPGKDQEYFSDGISEEILNLLTKVPTLKVISRTSSFSYKEKALDIKQIGKELHVAHILEGSIRKSGNTFRITVQLIDATTGTQIWSETFDRAMEDIFKIQDEIATKVTEQLKVSILGIALASTEVNTDAYTLYLQAKQLYHQKSRESTTNAILLNKESIAIDSTYAPAWSLLSSLYYQSAMRFVITEREEAINQGTKAAKKAIALDPEFVGGYITLAMFEHASWNFTERNKLMDKAMLLDPYNPRVIYTESDFASQSGNMDVAIELLLKTIELEPLNDWLHYFNLGYLYWMNGQYPESEEKINRFLFLHPDVGFVNSFMGEVQLRMGKPEKALEYLEKDTDPFWPLYRKSMVVYAMGNKQEADDLLKKFVADFGNIAWPNIADVYAFRGEKDEAFKWLELALKNKDSSLLEVLNYPSMKNLWGDPRWNKFLKKLRLPKNHGFHVD